MIFRRESRLPVRVQQKLLKHFVAGTTARTAAKTVGVQGRTAVIFFQRLRLLIASKHESFLLSRWIESYDSYLARRRTGRRGRTTVGTAMVVGLFMRGDRVHTAVIPDDRSITVIPIVQESVTPDSIIYVPSEEGCAVLDVSAFQYQCVNPSKTVLSRGGYHVNGVENFWNESRRYLRRFNGIPKNSFYSFLKECEWRFNEPDSHALSEQLKYWYHKRRDKP